MALVGGSNPGHTSDPGWKQAPGISKTNPGCGKATDPDMALNCSSSQMVVMALGGSPATQIGMAPVEARPSDTNVATCGSPNSLHPRGFCGNRSHKH